MVVVVEWLLSTVVVVRLSPSMVVVVRRLPSSGGGEVVAVDGGVVGWLPSTVAVVK